MVYPDTLGHIDQPMPSAAYRRANLPAPAARNEGSPMKTHRPTTQRPARRRHAAEVAPNAPAPSLEPLRDPAAPAPLRAAAIGGLRGALGNAAVTRELAQRDDSPAPAPAAPAAVSAADTAEYELLKGRITDADATAYVKHRDDFFGSAAAYQAFAAASDQELDATKGLRKRIELGANPAAQTVFYRWVRKAYHKAGVADVPALINRGTSEELKAAIDAVKAGYGEAFRSGGFNPRPMKSSEYKYRLGTISEHALGNAVDVEAARNPIISQRDWAFIEQIAELSVARGLARWQSEPQALWSEINALNEQFVANVAARIAQIEQAQAEALEGAPPPKKGRKARRPPPPINLVFKGHRALKKWAGGFFTLPWALVEQFHSQGFVWGATFRHSADLHHFELAKPQKSKKP